MKDKVTQNVANRQLEPLVRYSRQKFGTIEKLRKRLSQRTGKRWNRENLQNWLHKDPQKRTQPLFGVGLLLIEIGQELMREQTKPE